MYIHFTEKKEDFLRAAERTYASGIQTGTGGNLSVRLGDDHMLVKPSGFTYGECSERNLTITDLEGRLREGEYAPTQESKLHGNLYRRFNQIGGIVHTHSPYAILASLHFSEIECVTKHAALKLRVPIPVVDVESQAVTLEELPKVFRVFEAQPKLSAFILKGHSIVAVGSSAVKAGQIAELVEETAKIFWENEKMKKILRMKR